ncbi:MAG: urease accessory protein UreD [Janthinobacterium lividum]
MLPQARHQRAWGELRVSFKRRSEATVLDGLRQDGCLKARFPRTDPPDWPGAVTLNSAGGIAGGDRLATHIIAGAGTTASIASQAAERVYRALPGLVAEVTTRLDVAAGAALEWLPQETILFDRCALRRRLEIELADDSWFLGVESLVFGRAAMAEQIETALLHDRITLRRGGALLLHDAIRLDGPVAPLLRRAAIGGGGGAVATLIHAGPGAAGLLDPLRAALAPFEAGASCWDGVLLARIVAPAGGAAGSSLRRAVVAGLNILRGGRTLPRVWLC